MSMDGARLSRVEWRPAGRDTVKARLPNGMDALVWRGNAGIGYSVGRTLEAGNREMSLIRRCEWLVLEARAGRLL